jgi:hypothetical protein
MATVAQRTPVSKAFYAILDDTHGVLTKVGGTMYFMSDAGDIVEIEPAHCAYLMPLGEVGIAECQALQDRLHGGYAAIACGRAN